MLEEFIAGIEFLDPVRLGFQWSVPFSDASQGAYLVVRCVKGRGEYIVVFLSWHVSVAKQ